jgi:hypothetical protein
MEDYDVDEYFGKSLPELISPKTTCIDDLILKTTETLYYMRRSNSLNRNTIVKFLEILHQGLTEFSEKKETVEFAKNLEEFSPTLTGRSLWQMITNYFYGTEEDIAVIKFKMLKNDFLKNSDTIWNVFYNNGNRDDVNNKINNIFALLI